jgi:leucyl-tRNA synthetase
MSKSKGNVINPDDVVELYGADTIRLYEMFMGPLEAMKPWNTASIIGPRRFLERVWRLSEKVGGDSLDGAETVFHQTIKKVGADIESFGMNTAVSQLMICLNALESLSSVPKKAYEDFLKLLAPLAPHITEELWHELGNAGSIHTASWPEYDSSKLEADTITLAVQIMGKTKGTCLVPRTGSQEEIVAILKSDPKLAAHIPETPSKVIFVPGRIINFIA